MDILLDIVHSVDYGVLAYISEHWRGGLSDTVWKVFSLLGSYGAVWITLAVRCCSSGEHAAPARRC